MASVEMVRAMTARFTPAERATVEWAEAEALGYARGRVDATQDHRLPALRVEPMVFAAFYAHHVAAHIDRYRDGRSTARDDIRTAWERFMTQ